MMASVLQPDLMAALRTALLVVPSKPSVPFLGNVLLTIEADKLVVRGTDQDTYLHLEIEAQSLTPFTVCAPAKALYDTISEIPGGSIDLQLTDWHLQIKSDVVGFAGRIACYEGSEFPLLTETETANQVTFHPRELALVHQQISFAVSDDASRPVLHGVHLRRVRKHAEVSATDGHRLALLPLPESTFAEQDGNSWILRPHAIQLATRLARENSNVVAHLSEHLVEFRLTAPAPFTAINISAKLIDGPYPAIAQVIPSSTAWRMVFDRADLVRVVRRVRAASKQSDNLSHVNFDFEQGRVLVHGHGREMEGHESIPVQNSDPGPVPKIAWNGGYLVELLGLMETLTIEVSGNGPLNATVWREPSTDDSRLLLILMPLRRGDA